MCGDVVNSLHPNCSFLSQVTLNPSHLGGVEKMSTSHNVLEYLKSKTSDRLWQSRDINRGSIGLLLVATELRESTTDRIDILMSRNEGTENRSLWWEVTSNIQRSYLAGYLLYSRLSYPRRIAGEHINQFEPDNQTSLSKPQSILVCSGPLHDPTPSRELSPLRGDCSYKVESLQTILRRRYSIDWYLFAFTHQ